MKIYFNNLSQYAVQKNQVQGVVQYCASKLLDKELYNDLVLDINVERDFGYDAEAGVHDDEWDDVAPCLFAITLDQTLVEGDMETLLKTLCHEMVHIKQYMTGELRATANSFEYKCTEYSLLQPVSLAEYYAFPWEVEAYGLERALYFGYTENADVLDKLLAA